MVYCLLLTSAKTGAKTRKKKIFVLTFGFTELRSLFFDLALQNETTYEVPSSRKSEKKEKDTTSRTNLDLRNNNGI